MKPIRFIIPVIIGAGLVALYANGKFTALQKNQAQRELAGLTALVERQVAADEARIVHQLAGFSRTVSGDRDFSMKLIVEGDRSAPEVSEIAQRYMEPMDFALLEIVDSSLNIISCGQAPASAGSIVGAEAALLDTGAVFLTDDVHDRKALTLQARMRFIIAETPLFAIGGILADSAWLARLRPRPDVRLIIRQDKFILGTDRIESLSELHNNELIVNDTACMASAVTLPYAGKGDAPVLYVTMRKPATVSFLSRKK